MIKKFLAFSLVLLSFGCFAQSPVISAKDFMTALKSDKNLVVIDVNAADIYAKQHIQGAINLPHKDLYKAGPIEGQIKTAEELALIFGKKGVSSGNKIVLYDDGTNRYNSRVEWILKYIGATDVSLLNFNMDQFAAARIPLTASPSSAKAVTFITSPKPEMAISIEEMQSSLDKILLLDAREKDEFEGKDAAKRSTGHIPGAVWLNYKELLTATGAYKSKEEIIAIAAKNGATPEKSIVVYCQTGIKASVLYVALKEIAGFQNVRNYIGSFAEWAANPANKVVQ